MVQTLDFKSSIPKLDAALDPHRQRGQFILFAGLQGGGKTILAAQLARQLTLDGAEVLYLSSEVEMPELCRRNMAAICSIPYDAIKDGMNTVTLPAPGNTEVAMPNPSVYGGDAVRAAHPYLCALAARFSLSTYRPAGFDPRQELDDILADYRLRKHKIPDVLIYDYLRHPKVDRKDLDPVKMREAVITAAVVLKALAVEHRMLVIAFCQADPDLADRKKVDPGAIFDFKAVWDHADAFVGISQRLKDENVDDLTGGLYERVQHMNVTTKTSPKPVMVAVERAFEFQRFEPCQWSPTRRAEVNLSFRETQAHVVEKNNEVHGYVLARRKKFYEIMETGSPHAVNLYAFLLLVGGSGAKAGMSYFSRRRLTDNLGLSSKQLRAAMDLLVDHEYIDVPTGKARHNSLRYFVQDWAADQNPNTKGYFKLFRNLRDASRKDLMGNPEMFRLWLYLLSQARAFADETLELEPGEVLLKPRLLEENLLLNQTKLDGLIDSLQARGSVCRKVNSPFKLIITNWSLYQTKVYPSNRRPDGEPDN